MLMISKQHDEGNITFTLAGTLAGVWTAELERCWQATAVASNASRVAVDLTEVIFVDEAGKALLAVMARAGVELIAGDVHMKAIVEEIANPF